MRYKVYLVALPSRQEYVLDYEYTFAHVVKMTIVYTIMGFTASKWRSIPHMDIKNEFLHRDLKEYVCVCVCV